MDAIVYNAISAIDLTLGSYFGWAGRAFPFVPSGTADITISTSTTWNDAVGYKKVGKLTINAGQTLTIAKSPFIIFANEINFGDTSSCIDASGWSGGSSVDYSTAPTAKGATCVGGTSRTQGGCGGGMLFIIAGKITGAAGIIKANGGNGYGYKATMSNVYYGGQGCFSSLVNNTNGTIESLSFFLSGVSNYKAALTSDPIILSTVNLLGKGGSGYGGIGGGSGSGGTQSVQGGGSGIGGGGAGNSSTGSQGQQPTFTPTPVELLQLAQSRCLGGGGAGAYIDNGGNTVGAGGGGGGSIVIWTHLVAAQPTLQANGGIAASGTLIYGSDGAAGITYFILL